MRLVFGLLVLSIVIGSIPLSSSTRATDAAGLLIEWQAPPYRLTTRVGDDGQTYSRVEVGVEGYLNGGPPGWPSLPRLGRLVALPPGGEFRLELIEVTYETLPLEHPIEPAPSSTPPQRDADGEPLPGEWLVKWDEAAYSNPGPFPATFVELGDAAWMRDHRLARLTFTPFRYHADRGELDVARRVRFRVWWEPPAARNPTDDPLDDVLARLTLNPTDLASFRAPDSRHIQPTQATDPLSGSPGYPSTRPQDVPTYKILVETEGIYALDEATLAAAGLPVDSLTPSTLRLTHGAVEIAIQWEGDADAAFEAGERLLFYARPQPTRYAGHDVYWLTWGGGAGQRMTSRPGDPSALPPGTAWATALVEENTEYDWGSEGRDGDRWFWRKLKRPDLTSDTFQVPLETPQPGAAGQLAVWLRSFTSAEPNPDHHLRFSLNGADVGEAWWEGDTIYTATLGLPAGLTQAGSNSVGISLPGDTGSVIEGTWVDAIAVTYGLQAVSGGVARFRGQSGASAYTVAGFASGPVRVYDVTDPDAPRVVTDYALSAGNVSVGDDGNLPAEYLMLMDDRIRSPQAIVAAKSVGDPPDGADYLIITHPAFEAALAPLIAYRSARGLRVVTVDVEAIYDRFGDGRMHPQAIRSFLAHAYANWPAPALRYVLLVGDGTYDPRGYLPDTQPTYLPPYLADVDRELGETTSDNRYADLSDDLLPELRLGRFPVNTPAQVEAIVEKILSYETDPRPGDWNRRLVFGADNPSSAGNHPLHSDSEFNIYATPAYGYEGARVYLSETPGDPHLYTDAQEAQDALIAELDRGALLYTYFGHASWHQEAVLETDGYAPLFHTDHIARLNNDRRWPVVLHMTCLTGRYIHRTSNTLDESLLRTADVGAVAVWGASGSGVATGHRRLHRAFYQTVFDDGQTELSVAIHSALVSLYAASIYGDLIETYHLFGDPALALHLTILDLPFSVFLPIIGQVP